MYTTLKGKSLNPWRENLSAHQYKLSEFLPVHYTSSHILQYSLERARDDHSILNLFPAYIFIAVKVYTIVHTYIYIDTQLDVRAYIYIYVCTSKRSIINWQIGGRHLREREEVARETESFKALSRMRAVKEFRETIRAPCARRVRYICFSFSREIFYHMYNITGSKSIPIYNSSLLHYMLCNCCEIRENRVCHSSLSNWLHWISYADLQLSMISEFSCIYINVIYYKIVFPFTRLYINYTIIFRARRYKIITSHDVYT